MNMNVLSNSASISNHGTDTHPSSNLILEFILQTSMTIVMMTLCAITWCYLVRDHLPTKAEYAGTILESTIPWFALYTAVLFLVPKKSLAVWAKKKWVGALAVTIVLAALITLVAIIWQLMGEGIVLSEPVFSSPPSKLGKAF